MTGLASGWRVSVFLVQRASSWAGQSLLVTALTEELHWRRVDMVPPQPVWPPCSRKSHSDD